MFITFSSSTNWIMYCTVSWRLTINYLSSVAMHLYGWWVGNFLQKVQSNWILDFLFQGAFFTLISCMFFQFPCRLFLFTLPSLLYHYFDSSENSLLKTWEGHLSSPIVFTSHVCVVHWFIIFMSSLNLSVFAISPPPQGNILSLYTLEKRELRRVSSLSSFSLSWKQKKNEGFQLENRHLNLNRLRGKVKEFPSTSFCF